MKISKLITLLEQRKEELGNVEVRLDVSGHLQSFLLFYSRQTNTLNIV